jgi:hypothetical protein
VLVFATVIGSGAQYVWIWGWKAAHDPRRTRYDPGRRRP